MGPSIYTRPKLSIMDTRGLVLRLFLYCQLPGYDCRCIWDSTRLDFRLQVGIASFGTAALIPLYLLLRRFFDTQISALCALVFGMLPVFVGSSVDMVREPVCWFFLILGLYCI